MRGTPSIKSLSILAGGSMAVAAILCNDNVTDPAMEHVTYIARGSLLLRALGL